MYWCKTNWNTVMWVNTCFCRVGNEHRYFRFSRKLVSVGVAFTINPSIGMKGVVSLQRERGLGLSPYQTTFGRTNQFKASASSHFRSNALTSWTRHSFIEHLFFCESSKKNSLAWKFNIKLRCFISHVAPLKFINKLSSFIQHSHFPSCLKYFLKY